MRAPPGSQTQGEVHLTDNPADLDVITAAREHTAQSVSAQKRKHTQQAAVRESNRTPTASDERVRGGGGDTASPFASLF